MSAPITIGLSLALAVFPAALPLSAQRARVGQPAPEFSLESLAGTPVRLSDFRGHPVVLTFWATWCPPCQRELPALHEAYQAGQEAGLRILAVNDDERAPTIRAFVDRMGLAFPVLLDPHSRVNARYGVIQFPTTVFVDTAGIVRVVHGGAISAERLATDLQTILPAR